MKVKELMSVDAKPAVRTRIWRQPQKSCGTQTAGSFQS